MLVGVFDAKEMCRLTEATLDFWLTCGCFAKEFEKRFAEYLGVRYVSTVNSGSSVNLIAFSALTALELGERRIRRGESHHRCRRFPNNRCSDNPIRRSSCFRGYYIIPQYNIDISQQEVALSERTKAVFIAHTIGNPFLSFRSESWSYNLCQWHLQSSTNFGSFLICSHPMAAYRSVISKSYQKWLYTYLWS